MLIEKAIIIFEISTLWTCQNVKFCVQNKICDWNQKYVTRLEFEKAIAIFEVCILGFVKMKISNQYSKF